MERKKIILLAVISLILLGLLVYFFIPKTVKRCGSALPISCQVCKCSRGIPSPVYIGSSKVDCFGGELIECKTVEP